MTTKTTPTLKGTTFYGEKIVCVRTRVFRWKGACKSISHKLCVSPNDMLPMQDTQLQSFAFHSWLVVEIKTQSGAVGIGNAALAPQATKLVIDNYLKAHLIGKDPWDIEAIWQSMYRATMAFGRKGIGMVAISAIDIALWDLLGQISDKPLFKLMGGAVKDKVPVYASKLYNQPIDELKDEAQQYVDQGFKAVKMRMGYGVNDGAKGMRQNTEAIAAVRETVGDDVDVMVDAYMGWSLEYALQMIPRMSDYRLRWLEEPVIPDDIYGYAELSKRGIIPIAGGEHEFTLHGFRHMLSLGALDYIQFDTNRVGGISQARKIIALAEAFNVPVVPHAGQMHNYHLTMSSTICPIAEYFPPSPVEVGNELFWYLFKGEPIAVDGFINLSDNVPGLGIQIDEGALAEFEIEE